MALIYCGEAAVTTKKCSNSLFHKVLYTAACSGVFLLITVSNAWAQQAQDNYYGSHMMWHGSWGHGWFLGPILVVVFIVLAIAVVVLLVNWLGGSKPRTGSSTSSVRDPLDILKERFARGEIDAEEYEERRRVLRE